MIVVFSARFRADLDRVWAYIAEDNPRRAVSFVREIVERCKKLSEMPLRFPLIARYEHSGIRRMPYRNYLIFYRVGDKRIEVLHVLNGAQDYEALLFPDE